MSPEQATGDKSLDRRTDIWAMGVIAYECLLGRRPFAGDTMATIFVGIRAAPLPIPSSAGRCRPASTRGFFGLVRATCASDFVRQRSRTCAPRRVRLWLGASANLGFRRAPVARGDEHHHVERRGDAASVAFQRIVAHRVGPPSQLGQEAHGAAARDWGRSLRAASHGRSVPLDTPIGRERRRVRGHIGGTDPATHFGRVLSQARTIGQGRAPAAPSRAAPRSTCQRRAALCRILRRTCPLRRPSCRVTSRAVRRRSAPQLRSPPRPPPPPPAPPPPGAAEPQSQKVNLGI